MHALGPETKEMVSAAPVAPHAQNAPEALVSAHTKNSFLDASLAHKTREFLVKKRTSATRYFIPLFFWGARTIRTAQPTTNWSRRT